MFLKEGFQQKCKYIYTLKHVLEKKDFSKHETSTNVPFPN